MIIPKEDNYRFVIGGLIILVRSCVGLIWAAAGPLLLLIMGEYGISRGEVSWFSSIVSIVMAVFSVPVGLMAMRMRPKVVFAIGAFLQSTTIAALIVPSFPTLLLTRALFAIGLSMLAPIASSIYAQWFNARQLPMVNGITMAFITLGNAVAFVATVPLAAALSWRAALAVYGSVALVLAVAWVVWGKEKKGRPEILADDTGQATVPSATNGTTPPLSAGAVLRSRTTLLLALSMLGPFCLSSAIGFWLPTYYNQVFHIPLQRASSLTAIFTVTGMVASVLGGLIPMRLGRRKPFLIIPGILMGPLALAALMFNNYAAIFISVALFGIFSALQSASILTIPMELPGMTPRTGAMALSLSFGVGNIGGFIGPLMVGYLTDLTGSYLPGFIICAALSATLLVSGLLLPETGPKARH